jgi:hypothetical protein
VTDTLAYEIGAVFFLAVLFMAGTLTRGLFPKGILKTVKLSMFAVAALLVGFLAYRKLPDISSFDFKPSRSAQTPAQGAPAPGVAIKQNDATGAARKIRKTQISHEAPSAVDAVPEPQETSIPAVDPPSAVSRLQTDASSPPSVGETSAPIQSWRATPAQEPRNPVKRAIKSMGHFLHIGPEKYQPQPSVPQPAMAP